MSSILVDNINEIPGFNDSTHYLVFGRQNNPWGQTVLTDKIGEYIGFKLPKEINETNWNEFNNLVEYFNSFYFDPDNMMLYDCSTCGDRWDDEDVRTIGTWDELKSIHQNNFNSAYMPVHNLTFDFDNTQITCESIDILGEVPEDELLTISQLQDFISNNYRRKMRDW